MTWRSLLLAAVLVPLNIHWVTVVEVRWYSLDGAELPLFVTPVFMLFVLVLLNLAVGRLRRSWALTQGELLATYIAVVISCTIAGHDWWQNFFGAASHPFYFATAENGWEARFFQYLPEWSAVRNQDVLKGFYQGNTPLSAEIWQAWAIPLLVWGWLTVVVVAMMLCINVILRRQWTENERLTYPIVQLPLALTEESGRLLLRTPALWYGFTVAFGIGLLAGANLLLPSLPYLNVKQFDLHIWLTGRPWDYVGTANISFYPFMIGLAYFLPLDLAFSCWFFYVVRMAEQMIGGLAGGDTGRFFPRLPEQSAGGWLALAFIALWGSRDYLRGVWQQVVSGRMLSEEPLTYRTAVVGFLLGLAFLVWWTGLFGVGLGTALFFWLLFFALSLAMTRVRAELGSPHEIYFVNPRRIMMNFCGTSGFTPQELTFLSVSYWFNRCYRCHPMPPQLEAFKMAENDRLNARRLLWVILAVTALALVAASYSNLAVCYADGAAAQCRGFKRWVGQESYQDLSRWLEIPERWDVRGTFWLLGSFASTVWCNAMRRQFLWWPFHPAGYPLAVSFAMDYFWFAVFVAWLLKWTVLKIGGMRLYRQGIPFALGLILGDYTIGSIWAIVGPALKILTYKIFI
ncbi:MAG: hypothetical protein IT204_16860 [Fimbriimonadaceae bacterium]|nr:hypothetical protein [Fimbriimonadaceae bacterium]